MCLFVKHLDAFLDSLSQMHTERQSLSVYNIYKHVVDIYVAQNHS